MDHSIKSRTLGIQLFRWEQTAKRYRALYRKAAGRLLSDEDRQLLAPQATQATPIIPLYRDR